MSRVPNSYGQLLVFDDQAVYGVHAFHENVRVRRGLRLGNKGYRLFARNHQAAADRWSVFVPLRIRAMVLANDRLFVAGPPDVVPDDDPLGALEGRRGARLLVVSTADGSTLAEHTLRVPPVFDGLIAANRKLYITTIDGRVHCLGE
jgi:hypothetical protein